VYEDAPVPKITNGEALIKVHAAAITPTEFTWNSTFTTRDGRDRLPVIPGFEVSGTVQEAASDVSDLSAGDAVYGLLNFWRDGAAAEYVAVRARYGSETSVTRSHPRGRCSVVRTHCLAGIVRSR